MHSEAFARFAVSSQSLDFFSDACGGQNRKINIACLWIYIVSSPDFSYKVVDHKFMLPGHSLMTEISGQSRKKIGKHRLWYVPDVWCTLVEEARRKNPFEAIRMSHDNFVSLESVRSQIVYRKVNKGRQGGLVEYSMATNLPREAI